MTPKIMCAAAVCLYFILGVFCTLMIFLGAAVRIDAKNFLPAVAGVFLAVAGILENVEELRK